MTTPTQADLDAAREGCPVCGGDGFVLVLPNYSTHESGGKIPCPTCARVAKHRAEAREEAVGLLRELDGEGRENELSCIFKIPCLDLSNACLPCALRMLLPDIRAYLRERGGEGDQGQPGEEA